MKVFSGSANKPLAEKIAQHLGTLLSPLEINIFPDGEKRVRVVDGIVGEDCIVVQPTSTPADQNYMELFFIVDALKRSGARSVTAVIPYLGYERQDHVFRIGEAVSLEVIAKILKTVGVDKVITFDLHSIKIPEIFKIPVMHLSALQLFAEKIKDLTKNTILISPDLGGVRRIKLLSEMLNGMPYAVVVKHRDLATGEVVAEKIEGLPDWRGEVKKRAIIVDDMISTGSTIQKAAQLLEKNGASEIFVFATHAVFSGNATEVLQNSKVNKVFATDTIFIPQEKQFSNLKILSTASLVAKTIRDIM